VTTAFAVDGGSAPAFPERMALVRPRFTDVSAVVRDLEDVLSSGLLTNGRRVRELEEQLVDQLGVPYVVAVGSCTAGLMLTYQALGVRGPVVMPSHTFSASAHAVHWAGGTPHFVDIEPSRGTLDPAAVEAGLQGAVAISATHLYGHPAEAEALERIAGSHGLPLVFDSAHALGSRRRERRVGSLGTAEVFSMSPTKVTTAGEGGIVTTHDADLAEHVRLGRNYGNPGDYDCAFPGLNARMSELHAVLALHSLAELDRRMVDRGLAVHTFAQQLAGAPLRVVTPAPGDISTYKDLTLHVDRSVDVAWLQRALEAEGVDSRRYFLPVIHQQRAYARPGPDVFLPVTEDFATRVLTVPLYAEDPHLMSRLAEVVAGLADEAGRRPSAGPH
jgi:dTDP-4-amino-4,6-dideoxygalactose transaminase